jgi:hypothetical protein
MANNHSKRWLNSLWRESTVHCNNRENWIWTIQSVVKRGYKEMGCFVHWFTEHNCTGKHRGWFCTWKVSSSMNISLLDNEMVPCIGKMKWHLVPCTGKSMGADCTSFIQEENQSSLSACQEASTCSWGNGSVLSMHEALASVPSITTTDRKRAPKRENRSDQWEPSQIECMYCSGMKSNELH